MNIEAIPISSQKENEFDTNHVLTIASGHFFNDVYMSFVSPLLPLLIEKLSLSLTAAGTLAAISQIPAILNPLIGYLADRHNLRYLVIISPAITATFIGFLGIAPDPLILGILLFISGLSTAIFHAPAPAMISNISPKQLGKSMSWFMAGGELGYTFGPLLIVWAVSTWSLEGTYRLMFLGWAASLVLFWRFRSYSVNNPAGEVKDLPPRPKTHWRRLLPVFLRVFLPVSGIVLMRNFMTTMLVVFLPTYLNLRGAPFWLGGASISIMEISGVGGVLLSGVLSDRFGRKFILSVALVSSFLALLVFLNVSGWLYIPMLVILGFAALSANPILMAIVQENFPHHRAVSNGIYMALTFLLQSVATIFIGILGDRIGLDGAFFWCAVISLFAVPLVFTLPKAINDEVE